MGRKRINLSFEEARILVRNESLSSVPEYRKWHELNKPARIPKRPDRAYKKDFISWNDFLGSSNIFPHQNCKWRSYQDSMNYAHSLNFSSKPEWLEHVRNNKLPSNVPRRPDLVYRKTGEWFTWKQFLGLDIHAKIVNMQNMMNICFMYKTNNAPNNVFSINTFSGTKSALIEAAQKNNIKLHYAFIVHDENLRLGIMNQFCKNWWNGDKNDYVISDIGMFISTISDNFDKLT